MDRPRRSAAAQSRRYIDDDDDEELFLAEANEDSSNNRTKGTRAVRSSARNSSNSSSGRGGPSKYTIHSSSSSEQGAAGEESEEEEEEETAKAPSRRPAEKKNDTSKPSAQPPSKSSNPNGSLMSKFGFKVVDKQTGLKQLFDNNKQGAAPAHADSEDASGSDDRANRRSRRSPASKATGRSGSATNKSDQQQKSAGMRMVPLSDMKSRGSNRSSRGSAEPSYNEASGDSSASEDEVEEPAATRRRSNPPAKTASRSASSSKANSSTGRGKKATPEPARRSLRAPSPSEQQQKSYAEPDSEFSDMYTSSSSSSSDGGQDVEEAPRTRARVQKGNDDRGNSDADSLSSGALSDVVKGRRSVRSATANARKNAKKQQQKRKPKDSDSDGADNIVEEEEEGEVIEYRIQYILGSEKRTAANWRSLTESMSTQELTRGSAWVPDDAEYYSKSPNLVEKFLIKWQHCSFLHVSWETEHDLLQYVGSSAKGQIKKYRERVATGEELFSDLGVHEYFSPSCLVVERVLDVDCDSIDVKKVDWKNVTIPPEGDEAVDTSKPYLYAGNCFITIKWEGLFYRDTSFENVADLRKRGIEFEDAMRDFFRREQTQPTAFLRRVPGSKSVLRALAPELRIDAKSVPSLPGGGALRDYQWEGVRWMLFNWSQRRNSILADEMGLGKTIQSSVFLSMLNQFQNVRGPFLVVAPLSTVVNWVRELKMWTNLDVILYYGSAEDREIIREFEFAYMTRKRPDGYKLQVVVTSPEMCLAKDSASGGRELSQIYWEMLVVDEAHRMKNFNSKLCSTLREEFSYRHSLLLTGTPLQNNTEELWTLLHFVDRDEFASQESFLEKYGDLKDPAQLESLQAKLKPYLLRRIKEHVERSVPPKEEVIVEVELTVLQKQYYRAIYEMNKSFLFRGASKDGPRLSNLAMELRKCCNHPFLVKGAEATIREQLRESDAGGDALIDSSGKLVLLDKLLPKLFAGGHRVLIFSQFRIMLDILEDYLHHRGYPHERIDGAITGHRRQGAIDRFSAPDSISRVMLLSTRAGGVGINLVSADTVIIFDSDWNPQNDIQAQARAHRIGQTKSVKVYRLLTRKTYEMHLFQVASLKLGLDYAVMHNVRSSYSAEPSGASSSKHHHHHHHSKSADAEAGEDGDAEGSAKLLEASSAPANNNLSKKDIENLLKRGAYDMFREENEGKSEQESKTFCEADIDQILERSTHIIHDAAAGGDSKITGTQGGTLGGALNSFSKASFVSSKEMDDVAVDDPQFWEKVMGLSKGNDEEEGTGKRKRKCRDTIHSYHEDAMHEMAKRAGAGMTIQPLGSKSATATESDGSDSDSSDGRGAARRRVEAVTPDAIFALTNSESEAGVSTLKNLESKCAFDKDLTKLPAEVVESINQALGIHGFGNWSAIRIAAQLQWSVSEIAYVCGHLVLHFVKLMDPQAAANAGETTLKTKAGVDHYLKMYTSKLVHCALAAAEYANVGRKDNTDVSSDCINELLVSRYTAARAAAAASDATSSIVDWDPKKPVYDLLGNMLDPSACVSALKSCSQYVGINVTSFVADDLPSKAGERSEIADKFYTRMLAVFQPELALAKLGIQSLKNKFQNLETMFELHVAMKATNLPEFANPLEDEDEAKKRDLVHQVLKKANAFISMFWYEFVTLEDMPDNLMWWTYRHDAMLVAVATEANWFQAKRRFLTHAEPGLQLLVEASNKLNPKAPHLVYKSERDMIGLLTKRIKEITTYIRNPKLYTKASTGALLAQVGKWGVPFRGLYSRPPFLGPVDSNAAATDAAIEAKEDAVAEGDTPITIPPYPETPFIGPPSRQSTAPFVPCAQMCLAHAGLTWDTIVGGDRRIISKAKSIETINFLLSITEVVKERGNSSEKSPYKQLGYATYAVLFDTLTVIECMWRAKELLLRPSLAFKNAAGELCTGVACSCASVVKPEATVAPAVESASMEVDEKSTAPDTTTAATGNNITALEANDPNASIHAELCPYHAELASFLSYRLPRPCSWWTGVHDVRLVKLVATYGLPSLTALTRLAAILSPEEVAKGQTLPGQLMAQMSTKINTYWKRFLEVLAVSKTAFKSMADVAAVAAKTIDLILAAKKREAKAKEMSISAAAPPAPVPPTNASAPATIDGTSQVQSPKRKAAEEAAAAITLSSSPRKKQALQSPSKTSIPIAAPAPVVQRIAVGGTVARKVADAVAMLGKPVVKAPIVAPPSSTEVLSDNNHSGVAVTAPIAVTIDASVDSPRKETPRLEAVVKAITSPRKTDASSALPISSLIKTPSTSSTSSNAGSSSSSATPKTKLRPTPQANAAAASTPKLTSFFSASKPKTPLAPPSATVDLT